MRRLTIMLMVILLGAGLTAGPDGVSANDFPNRPVQLIIPFPPGGLVDLVARAVTNVADAHLGP
ncbi:MAG: hypothetical protein ACREJ9_11215 [Candidatus Rokuibacteriota bacterium]